MFEVPWLTLEALGITPLLFEKFLHFQRSFARPSALRLGRVTCELRGRYDIRTTDGVEPASLAGKLAHDLSSEARPAVGDWVALVPGVPVGRVVGVLERTNILRRMMVGGTSRPQALAANVDLCLIVGSLTTDDADEATVRRALSARRIERYLVTAQSSRVPAMVVVNKADLSTRGAEQVQRLGDELGPSVPIVLVSARTGQGLSELRERLAGGTVVVLGSSGVGKSSLTNWLLDHELARVSEAREADGRGRHTTTSRELYPLPGGGVLIDTPGMRELALWADGESEVAESAFDEFERFARHCRFRDCAHHGEPGCAVQAALSSGELSQARALHADKLEREREHQRQRVDVRLRQEQLKKRRVLARAMRARGKARDRD